MSEYSPPNTQNPIFDPIAWLPRSVIAADTSTADVLILANEANEAYNTAKTINLALSKYGVFNVSYNTQTGLVCNAPVLVYTTPLPAGSYVISGTILVNANTIGTSWTALYMYANIQGVNQQGWAVANNVAQYATTSLNYVPFTFYCASPSNSQADIPLQIYVQLNGPTTSGLSYTIGPCVGGDISICEIIGSNPYLAY
jgi:hypothetical protein